MEVTQMAFRVLFLAHAPDADPEKHRCVIETGKYKLYSLVVRNQSQAVEECKKLVADEGIHSIILCPGFAHKSVAEIADATGGNVVVSVARGDGPSSRLSAEIRKRELS
jgi:hypothetical protein